MSSSFGKNIKVTIFGESHGPAIGGIIDGCPAGLPIDTSLVDAELKRRRQGDTPSADTTPRREPDQVEWLSGLLDGTTLGTPIAFLIRNRDQRSEDYDALRHCCRPGHADYTYWQKYGLRDHRGGGRASGRETASRVVAGAVAKMWLRTQGVTLQATRQGYSITCRVLGLPAGVGEPIFDRLNARLAYAALSIPSAMAFAMGEGVDDWRLSADDYPDQWVSQGQGETLTATNHCGGIQGGISNGMPVVFHVGFHPPVTRPDGMDCRCPDGTLKQVAPHGRHDSDHGARLPIIVESMAALTVADLLLTHTASHL